jgi:hypothetical protein
MTLFTPVVPKVPGELSDTHSQVLGCNRHQVSLAVPEVSLPHELALAGQHAEIGGRNGGCPRIPSYALDGLLSNCPPHL